MSKKDDLDAWRAAWVDAMKVTSLGWDLAIPICGGAVLGYLLDRRFHTGHVLTLGLLLLGVIVGVYNLARTIRSEIERDRREIGSER